MFLSARTGAEAAAKELSQKHGIPIEIVWLTPPAEDGQVQAQRIAQAVNEGASAMLISCSDAGKVTGAINDAVGRGVPVMTFDSDAPQSNRFAFYGVDDIKTGEAVMRRAGAADERQRARSRFSPATRTRRTFATASQGSSRKRRNTRASRSSTPSITSRRRRTRPPKSIRVQNAYPEITGWAMIGGWPLFTQTLLTDLDPEEGEDRLGGRAAGRARVRREGARPGAAGAADLHVGIRVGAEDRRQGPLKQDVPQIIPMELVRVTKDNLGTWARQLKTWGFTDVPDAYLKLP